MLTTCLPLVKSALTTRLCSWLYSRLEFANWSVNLRGSLAGQTGVETAIATARLFLGVRASSLGLQKALDALYNFPAGSQVVGCKPGPQNPDEGGFPTKPG